jgi:hypothetical protein
MKTIEYILKSHPEIRVEIPEESGKAAEETLNNLIALKKSGGELFDEKFLSENPYLKEKGMITEALHFMDIDDKRKCAESLVLQDDIYLKICLLDIHRLNVLGKYEVLQYDSKILKTLNKVLK